MAKASEKQQAAETQPSETAGYIVFTRNDVTGEWRKVGESQLNGQSAAIKDVAGENPEGAFAAVPKRSWRPVRFVSQTITRTLLVDETGTTVEEGNGEPLAEEEA